MQPDLTELEERDIEIALLTAEVEKLKAAHDHVMTQATDQLKTANKLIRSAIDYRKDEVWFWQGDGSDRLESLSCPVIIHPIDLIALIKGAGGQNET